MAWQECGGSFTDARAGHHLSPEVLEQKVPDKRKGTSKLGERQV